MDLRALPLTLMLAAALIGHGRTRVPLGLLPVETVWTLDLNNPLTAPPAIDSSRAYFPIEGSRLAAYRLDRGSLDWTAPVDARLQPVTGDGLVFVVEPRTLTALQGGTGAVAWQLPLTETLAVHPVWDNGWLIAATSTGSVLAFRAQDGFLVWRRDLGVPAHGLPGLAADRVYVPTADGRVVALRVDTGAIVWDRRLGGAPNDVLALEDRVYVGARDNYFYSLDAKDGRVDWRWRTGGDVIGLAAVDDTNVYFVSLDNVLRALGRTSGGQKWIRALPLRPTGGPILASGTLVVTGAAPTARAYRATDGTAAGEIATKADVTAPAFFVDGLLPRLLVTTNDIAKGATALLVTRTVEPAILPLAPLPNPAAVAPVVKAPK